MLRLKAAQKPLMKGDQKALDALVDLYDESDGQYGVSQEWLDDKEWKFEQPGDYLEAANQKAIELFMEDGFN